MRNQALISACANGDYASAMAALERGAYVGSRNVGNRWTPLHYAARTGHVDLCQLLLKHGALRSATNTLGRTPLELAEANGRAEVISIFFDHIGSNDGPLGADEDMSEVARRELKDDVARARYIEAWLQDDDDDEDDDDDDNDATVGAMPILNVKVSLQVPIGLEIDEEDGRVLQVLPDSQCHGKGVEPWDMITAVNGVPVSSGIEVKEKVQQIADGRLGVLAFEKRRDAHCDMTTTKTTTTCII